MDLPKEAPVMTLPSAILFPQAMLPLFIFEKRYRLMLEEVLNGNRMFAVALQKPGRVRESPSVIAGLGLVRASVKNKNGTSNLILQGLTRIELGPSVQVKPYRIHKISRIESVSKANLDSSKLIGKLIELASERLEQGFHYPVQFLKTQKSAQKKAAQGPMVESILQSIRYLSQLEDPEQLADLISCTLLSNPIERQVILETKHIENRLKHLVGFLMAEIERNRPNSDDSNT